MIFLLWFSFMSSADVLCLLCNMLLAASHALLSLLVPINQFAIAPMSRGHAQLLGIVLVSLCYARVCVISRVGSMHVLCVRVFVCSPARVFPGSCTHVMVCSCVHVLV